MHAKVLLSIQRALLGEVTANLRAVACDWDEKRIVLRFIIDGPADDTLRDDLQAVGSEVIADFVSPMQIEEQIVRVDLPEDLKAHGLKAWAYMRRERVSD